MSKSYRQLVLCPQNPQWIPAARDVSSTGLIKLEQVLRSLGLIADQVDATQRGRFYIGEQFLQHISFMGCAPALEFQPTGERSLIGEPDWQQFTFVHIPPVLDEPGWYADLSMAKPQCPECTRRSALSGDKQVNYFDEFKYHYCCPHCQQKTKVCEVNWREFGGCARVMISIVNVYPKEAIPTENLLLQLEKQTQIAWRYFYYDGSLMNLNDKKLNA